MNRDAIDPNVLQPDEQPALVSLHPAVYRIIAALGAIFVIAAWAFFSGGYGGLVGAVVAAVFIAAIGIPGELWNIWRHHHDRDKAGGPADSFGHWLSHDVAVQRYRLRGSDAALTALLPIAAVAIGLALLAVIHAVVVS